MTLPAGLVKAAKAGHLVPLVGAGVSMSVTAPGGGRLFPSWWGLLEGFVAGLEAEGRTQAALVKAFMAQQPPDLMQAARYARAGFGADWYRTLQRVFDPLDYEPTSLALPKALWRLSDLQITTNYDRVLEWASPRPSATRRIGVNAPALAGVLRAVDRPTVWHLHGHVDAPEKIILTPDGYARLYPEGGAVETEHEAGLATLRGLLASRTLLFVGFSLEDAAFVRQLEWVRDTFQGAGGPHYVLVRAADQAAMVAKLGDLDVRPVPFADFGPPLVAVIDALADAAGRGASAPTAPVTPPVTPAVPVVTPPPTVVPAPSVHDIVDRANAADLLDPTRRSLLLAGLSHGFVGGLPVLNRPRDQALSDLHRLSTARLASVEGSPLAVWLTNAAEMLAGEDHPDAELFRAWAAAVRAA